MIRFTPRKAGSIWSSVNVKRVEVLTGLGRMRPAGLAAFAARTGTRTGVYSFEQGQVELPEPLLGELKENTTAWAFFERQPASYRKAVSWWVVSAKRDETRRKRFATLVGHSERAERVPQFTSKKSSG